MRITLHRMPLSALIWRLEAFAEPDSEPRIFRWMLWDVEEFERRWHEGQPMDRIAFAMGRTVGAIKIRRFLLNLPKRIPINGGEVRWRSPPVQSPVCSPQARGFR